MASRKDDSILLLIEASQAQCATNYFFEIDEPHAARMLFSQIRVGWRHVPDHPAMNQQAVFARFLPLAFTVTLDMLTDDSPIVSGALPRVCLHLRDIEPRRSGRWDRSDLARPFLALAGGCRP
jgi:hypothetical protein